MSESNAAKSGDRVSYHVLENQIEGDLADDADATPTPSRLATLSVSGSGAAGAGASSSKRPDGYAPVPVG